MSLVAAGYLNTTHQVHLDKQLRKQDTGNERKMRFSRECTCRSSAPRALNIGEINGNYPSCTLSLEVAKWGAAGTLVPSFSNWLCMPARSIFPLKLHFACIWFPFLLLFKWFILFRRRIRSHFDQIFRTFQTLKATDYKEGRTKQWSKIKIEDKPLIFEVRNQQTTSKTRFKGLKGLSALLATSGSLLLNNYREDLNHTGADERGLNIGQQQAFGPRHRH